MKYTMLLAGAVVMAAGLAGCESTGIDTKALTPIIGAQNAAGIGALGHGWNALSMSEKDETSLGQSIGIGLTNRYPILNNDRIQKYVALVGMTVASVSPNPTGNWIFGVIDTPEVNAFSGPGGVVIITKGALDRMQDEAELAGVLAHEVTHICNHDGLKQVKQAEGSKFLTSGMQAAGGQVSQLSGMADQGLDVVTSQGFSQPQELAADSGAVPLLMTAGYDAGSYLRYLQRLQQEGAGSGGRLMSTHPGMDRRIATVSQAIGGRRGGATLKDRFTFNVKSAAPMPAPAPMGARPYPAPAPTPTYVPPQPAPGQAPTYVPPPGAPRYTPAPPPTR